MIDDDDDLPVLTQVLVTASGRAPPSRSADPFDGRIEPVLQNALVIGSDPDDEPLDPVADPRRPTTRDAFSSSVPNGDDHDDAMRAHEPDMFAIDLPPTEPPFVQERAVENALRDDVVGVVLDQLAARIDTELDARIAQTIRVELDTAIGQLQERVRGELSEALRDVVGIAVDEAIARHRAARHAKH